MERRHIISILLYGGVSLVGSLIVAMAPGNNVRVETHARLDYLEVVIKSFYHLRNYISNDFLGLDLILYIFALILFFSIFHKSRSRDFHSPYRLAAFHVLAWLIIVGLAFIAAVYGTGKDLPGRAQNQLQIVGLGSTAVMVGAIVLANKVAIRNFMEEKLRGAYDFRGVVFFLTLVALLINPVFLSAAIGFANGRVQSVYEQEVDRVNRILAGPDDVRVPPIIERSKLNSPRDIVAPDQSGYWVNECMAMFFGKRSIVPDLAQEPSD
jgi:hypothetical protein